MNRQQMLKASGKTPTLVKALKISIRKFTQLPRYWPKWMIGQCEDHWPEKENCALCHYILYRHQDCDYCPLGTQYESRCGDTRSFYEAMDKAITEGDKKAFMLARKGMLLALKAALEFVEAV